MNGRFLLDTNIIIAIFAKDTVIHTHLNEIKEVFIPSITIGELYFGAYNSSKIKDNINRIDEFVLENTILSCNSETAKIYGEIKTSLKEKGKPIPENDIWIAAIAKQYLLALATKDTHFNEVKNLEVEIW